MKKPLEYTKRIERLNKIQEKENKHLQKIAQIEEKNIIKLSKETKSKETKSKETKSSSKRIKDKFKPKDGLNFKKYRAKITRLTNKHDLSCLENFGDENYQLDHKISIWFGFHNNIDARIMSDIRNLKFIPKRDNGMKSYFSVVDEFNEFIINENKINPEFNNTLLTSDYDKTIDYSYILHKYKKLSIRQQSILKDNPTLHRTQL